MGAARGRALADERALLAASVAAGPARRAVDPEALEGRAERQACALARPHPARVVNATGIALHTNLGRAPLAEAAVAGLVRAAQGYSALEIDLVSGSRGSRSAGVVHKLCLASGAAGALVVNNNAAALLLVLAALARGREVIVSRGELVEIGGSLPGFELPTWVVALRAPTGAARFAKRLRCATPPVPARIRDDLVVFDVRTLLEGDEKALEQALRGALH